MVENTQKGWKHLLKAKSNGDGTISEQLLTGCPPRW